MRDLFLNELSLEGQFKTVDEFFIACIPFMKCVNFINKENENKDKKEWQLLKHSQLYNKNITPDLKLNQIRGMKGDLVRKFKSVLLKTIDCPPFWDTESLKIVQNKDENYYFNKINVTNTSLAEAAERSELIISFDNDKYRDCIISINNSQNCFKVKSAVNDKYIIINLYRENKLDIYSFLEFYFKDSRLDFSKFDKKYGFDNFEKREIDQCIEAFQLMAGLNSWDDVFKNHQLYYKAYHPASKKKDWFEGTEYEGMQIDKFRCGNPKRCFGYKDGDKFYVLRMERDHSISDNG